MPAGLMLVMTGSHDLERMGTLQLDDDKVGCFDEYPSTHC